MRFTDFPLLRSYSHASEAWKWLIPIFYFAFFAWITSSSAGDALRTHLIAPLEFRMRSALRSAPEIHPRLKVIIYGDSAKKEFGIQELIPTAQWQKFIEAVASREPRVVLFDKFFSFPAGTEQEKKEFVEKVAQLNTTVIAGAAFGAIDENEIEFPPEQFSPGKFDGLSEQEQQDLIDEASQTRLIAPHPSLRKAFTRIGHNRLDNIAAIAPAWRIKENKSIIPFLPFAFAKQITFASDRRLSIDGIEFRLDRHNRIPVDFLPRNAAYNLSLPAGDIFQNGFTSTFLNEIQKDDVVLVLPSMYAGSTDFKNTPVGRLEGGFYHMSVLNSLLSGKPLIPIFQGVWSSGFLLLLAILFSTFFALKYTHKKTLVALLFGTAFIIVLGLIGFIRGRYISDWHLQASLFFINGATLLAIRVVRFERQSEKIAGALEGMVAPEVLETLKNKPELLLGKPKSLHATILFVDIEGFSLRTKGLLPVEVFQILQTQLGLVAQLVQQFGGIVDKNMGDGMLCYFGYNFAEQDQESASSAADVAMNALECAIEIQRQAATITSLCRDPDVALGTLMPLRLGLNSGEVFLGNLGSGRRLDFTVVGDTVNYCKRLEDACEPFRIIMSTTTKDLIHNHPRLQLLINSSDVVLHERKLAIKHKTELESGIECDPFVKTRDLFVRAFRLSRAIRERAFQRFAPLAEKPVKVTINDTSSGAVVNFSRGAFCLRLTGYFCRKVVLRADLRTTSSAHNKRIAELNLSPLFLQVVWGSSEANGEFLHGLTIMNLSAERQESLEKILREAST